MMNFENHKASNGSREPQVLDAKARYSIHNFKCQSSLAQCDVPRPKNCEGDVHVIAKLVIWWSQKALGTCNMLLPVYKQH